MPGNRIPIRLLALVVLLTATVLPAVAQTGGYPTAPPSAQGPQTQPKNESGEDYLSRAMTAVGVSNDKGEVRWPLALRVLPGDEARQLVAQAETLFQLGALQAIDGTDNARLAEEATRVVSELRQLLHKHRNERATLTDNAYEDGERFLNQLSRATRTLKSGLGAPAGEARLTTQKAPSTLEPKKFVEVTLVENAFEPKVLTVAAGTTVRWTNTGHHAHTVTADDDSWTSGDLAPKGIFTHTFAKAGTYPYHCRIHPKEMRGSVVVK